MASNRVAGRRIREHRINLGLSPERYGARIGVSGGTVRRIEAGLAPTVRTMFLIASDMGVLVTELFPATASVRQAA
jgi:transcriptional regulator with XRE-family HTH domain